MVDYSKWKDIEVSDDEDETHPNIDTPSLFRWRHQARIEKMEQHQKELDDIKKRRDDFDQRWSELQKKLEDGSKSKASPEVQDEVRTLELEKLQLDDEQSQINLKEKKMPWNVDTISKEGFAKTIINKKPTKPVEDDLTEDEKEEKMKEFFKQNESDLKKFGMLKRYNDSKEFLKNKPHLVCENTANFLVIWCIDLAMEEKFELMDHVSHQVICMQYMLELVKQFQIDPRSCISTFFSRIQVANHEYQMAFDDELRLFKERIRKRAAEKLEILTQKIEEEERQKRLGPGGLDPVEVYESLPEALKKCFDLKDVTLLQKTISEMPEEEATHHMNRCIDSGLWVPDAKKSTDDVEDPEIDDVKVPEIDNVEVPEIDDDAQPDKVSQQ